jgi:cysteinyl-tRNA synthetase
VNDWAYQLQGRGGRALDLSALQASRFDLAVIDYSATGGASGEFSPAAIEALKHSPPGRRRTVLAYMSIGEAESYRFYFDRSWVDPRGRRTRSAPSWLARQNPDFPGNFKVRYWDPEWQRVIFGTASGTGKSYLDRILDQGFDGVYLDLIDAFEHFRPGGPQPERPSAAADMVSLVAALSRYARETRARPDFVVVPQNGSSLLPTVGPADREAYLAAIDAIGAEDTFFFGSREQNNPLRPQRETIRNLALFQAAGKGVLSVDYVTQRAKVRTYFREAGRRGYVGYATVRALDRIVVARGHAPD